MAAIRGHRAAKKRLPEITVGSSARTLFPNMRKFVDVRITSDASPDPDDNPFCACAERGRATFNCEQEGLPSKKLRGRGDIEAVLKQFRANDSGASEILCAALCCQFQAIQPQRQFALFSDQ